MATDTSKAADIKLIHIAKGALGLAEDSYRSLLAQYGNGATSSTELTVSQRRHLLQHFKAAGFQLRPKSGNAGSAWRREPQMRKLRAMWYALAAVQAVELPANGQACDHAIETWAKHQVTELDALRFADGQQMDKLIEAMKAWGRRVGAEIR